MSSQVWKIRLLGGFRIESPTGDEIVIPYRKARALMALLALHDGLAVTRETLGQYLWPDKPKLNQQQSLRQAIKDLKEAFVPHQVIDATRDICRLTLENYTCDALECLNSGKDAGNAPLLPEMPEPIFDSYRSELASYAPLGDIGEAARGAASLLEWTLLREPARALDMLHTCRELIPSMPLPLVEDALRKSLDESSEDHTLRDWGLAQFAIVLMWAGRGEEGIRVAKEALGTLQPEKHAADWAASVHSASMFLLLRGRFEKAKALLEEAMEIAEGHRLQEAIHRFRHAEALLEGYQGNFDRALTLLDALPPNRIILLHQAIYSTLAGNTALARERLNAAKADSATANDARMATQIGVAEGYTLIAEGRQEEARLILQDLIPFCESYGIRLVMIHAIEGLALLEQDPEKREELLRRAMELRERHRLPLLPGDQKRLAATLDSPA